MTATPTLAETRLTILLFHGVVENPDHGVRNYTRKHLGREDFARCLRCYQEAGTALSLEEVVALHRLGSPYPPRAFAITFDDGYENNVSQAAPILADLNLPATFFLTTDFLENNTMTWIDQIEYCLAHTNSGRLRLPWQSQSLSFHTTPEKIAVLDEIRRMAKQDPRLDLETFVQGIFDQCRHPRVRQLDDSLNQKMSWKQAAQLVAHPLFAVGGHTHTHAILSFLTPAQLDFEIGHCLDLIREKLQFTPRLFSYPEGQSHCFNESVIENLKMHGIDCSPTAIAGYNDVGTDLFHLRRHPVIL